MEEEKSLPMIAEKAPEEMKESTCSISPETPIAPEESPESVVWVSAISVMEENMPVIANTPEEIKIQKENQSKYITHMMTRFARKPEGSRAFPDIGCDISEMQELVDAFKPEPSSFRPRTVVVHGLPGTCKSALAKKVQLGWLQGEVYQDLFSYVFFLRVGASQLGLQSSLAELICGEWPEAPVSAILAEPEKLLFVIDDFELDETLMDEGKSLDVCKDWTEKAPVQVVLHSLLVKALLPDCSVMVTVSDAALEVLALRLNSPRYLWVGGLLAETRIKWLSRQDLREDEVTETEQRLVESLPLFDQCRVPALCRLVSLALRWQQRQEEERLPLARQTLTNLVSSLVLSHPRQQAVTGWCLHTEEGQAMPRLSQLAAKRLQLGCRLSLEQQLATDMLSAEELRELLSLHDLFPELNPWSPACAFMLLSLQSFLAALHFVLGGAGQEGAALKPLLDSGGQQLHPHYSAMAHLLEMVQFLFGLMNQEEMQTLEDLLGQPVARQLRWDLQQHVSLLGRLPTAPRDVLDAFHCLFETQDPQFMRSALSSFQDVRLPLMQPMDLQEAAFCLPHCPHLKRLRLDMRALFPEDPTSESAAHLGLQEIESWEKFCNMLSISSSLHQLELSDSILTEEASKTLFTSLSQPTCNIQKLIFKCIQMPFGLCYLWEALISNHNIKHLDLKGTPLKYEDVQMACEALKHPKCALESLRLDHCALTEACCPLISKVFTGSSSLQFLSLAGNNLMGQGLKLLLASLGGSQCYLQKLGLGDCGLQVSDCKGLSCSLFSNVSLTHLSLSHNKFGSKGMNLLCVAICLPSCPLQRLRLNDCDVDVAACDLLALALERNSSLTHLSLSGNPLGDDGVTLLCKALVTSGSLHDLELMRCHLTAASCQKLSCVITENKHLKSLDLGSNALGDSGVLALCKGLRQGCSSLRRLGLEDCMLTDACCEDLCSALACSQHLIDLNLLRNTWEMAGVRRLCAALKNPESALQRLGLWYRHYPLPVQKLLEGVKQLRPELVIEEDWYAWDREDIFWWKN